MILLHGGHSWKWQRPFKEKPHDDDDDDDDVPGIGQHSVAISVSVCLSVCLRALSPSGLTDLNEIWHDGRS